MPKPLALSTPQLRPYRVAWDEIGITELRFSTAGRRTKGGSIFSFSFSLFIDMAGDMKALSGWKEIAGHLHQAIRTVQRWENSGLPIHRMKTGSSLVFAFEEELDAWKQSTPLRYSEVITRLQARVEFLESELSLLKRQVSRSRYRDQPRAN